MTASGWSCESPSLGDAMPLPFLPRGFLPSTNILTFCPGYTEMNQAGWGRQRGQRMGLKSCLGLLDASPEDTGFEWSREGEKVGLVDEWRE